MWKITCLERTKLGCYFQCLYYPNHLGGRYKCTSWWLCLDGIVDTFCIYIYTSCFFTQRAEWPIRVAPMPISTRIRRMIGAKAWVDGHPREVCFRSAVSHGLAGRNTRGLSSKAKIPCARRQSTIPKVNPKVKLRVVIRARWIDSMEPLTRPLKANQAQT